jgi:UDP-GlcNAc:undecaprenyl-phosphate/decaprenyl-phosphate GlcNAc-1-phosphate transferase
MLIRSSRRLFLNYPSHLPQRFHIGVVPRIGGVGIVISSYLSWLFASKLSLLGLNITLTLSTTDVVKFIIVSAPIFVMGFYEDLTQSSAVKIRLLVSAIASWLACFLLELSFPYFDFEFLDSFWRQHRLLGVFFAFAILTGMPHAFNIIDGYNGLAGMVAIMICTGLVYVFFQLGDRTSAGMLVCVIGATAGFMIWNYPRGLIFAGDGGSYFWGFIIAIFSIRLVQKFPQVSPWFIALLLIYPLSETLFSIYRKLVRGQSPGMADSLHFHQLVYKRLVRGVFHDNYTRHMLIRNNRTSPYLWALCALSIAPAILFWYSTPILMFFCILFIVGYITAYFMIIRFKVPKWLKNRLT